MKFTILTLFPNIILEYINTSIISNAIKKGLVEIEVVDIRKFGVGKRRNVDDTVYGGGSGMVITVPVLDRAISSIKKSCDTKIIYLSPKGKVLNQEYVKEMSKTFKDVILICGHYEGLDERIFKLYDITEISIGDYILTGGELAALTIIDAVSRLIPGVLTIGSAENESLEDGLLEEGEYTKPQIYKGLEVPNVLLNGNHAKIDEFRFESKVYNTYSKRPDLYNKYIEKLNDTEKENIYKIIQKKEEENNGYNSCNRK